LHPPEVRLCGVILTCPEEEPDDDPEGAEERAHARFVGLHAGECPQDIPHVLLLPDDGGAEELARGCPAPEQAPGYRERERLVERREGAAKIAGGDRGLAGRRQEARPRLALGAAAEPPRSPVERRRAVLPAERLLGRARVERDRARRLAAALEVLCQHHRIALAGPLEPGPGELVTEGAIGLREHRIRPLAEQRVPKGKLFLAWEAAVLPALDQLQRGEPRERAR